MNDKADREQDSERHDFVRNYRPVAIRSVVAAHAMIPKARPEVAFKPPAAEMGFALPAGFYAPSED